MSSTVNNNYGISQHSPKPYYSPMDFEIKRNSYPGKTIESSNSVQLKPMQSFNPQTSNDSSHLAKTVYDGIIKPATTSYFYQQTSQVPRHEMATATNPLVKSHLQHNGPNMSFDNKGI